MALVENWIWRHNFDALVAELEAMAGEHLDEGLRKLLIDDVKDSDTDATPQRWASTEFFGPRLIPAQFGIDPGTNVLFVKLEVPEDLQRQAETTLNLMQRYDILLRDAARK
ncbi:MAG: hypothetical protein ABUL42_03290 [Terricaulis silvestris]